MKDLSKARIFIATERIRTGPLMSRSYSGFRGAVAAYGNAAALYDQVLPAGKVLKVEAVDAAVLVVVPLVGAITYRNADGQETEVEPGQSLTVSVAGAQAGEIFNRHGEDDVNFLQIWTPVGEAPDSGPRVHHFGCDMPRNLLLPLSDLPGSQAAFIGTFDESTEISYTLTDSNNSVVAFVVNGIFEIQHRLLAARDALSVWNIDEIEVEAFHNNAILVLAEIMAPADSSPLNHL